MSEFFNAAESTPTKIANTFDSIAALPIIALRVQMQDLIPLAHFLGNIAFEKTALG